MTQTTYDAIETGELDIEELRDVARYWRDLSLERDKELEQLKNNHAFKKFEFDVQKLTFQPGDILAICAPEMITDETATRLKEWAEKHIGIKTIVLADGLKPKVLAKEETS